MVHNLLVTVVTVSMYAYFISIVHNYVGSIRQNDTQLYKLFPTPILLELFYRLGAVLEKRESILHFFPPILSPHSAFYSTVRPKIIHRGSLIAIVQVRPFSTLRLTPPSSQSTSHPSMLICNLSKTITIITL